MVPDGRTAERTPATPAAAAPTVTAVSPVQRGGSLSSIAGSRSSTYSLGSSNSVGSGSSSDAGEHETGAIMFPAMFVEANIADSSDFSIGHRIEFKEPVILVTDPVRGMRMFPVPVNAEEDAAGMDGKMDAAAAAAVKAVRESATLSAAIESAEKNPELTTSPARAAVACGAGWVPRAAHFLVAASVFVVAALAFVLWATLSASIPPGTTCVHACRRPCRLALRWSGKK